MNLFKNPFLTYFHCRNPRGSFSSKDFWIPFSPSIIQHFSILLPFRRHIKTHHPKHPPPLFHPPYPPNFPAYSNTNPSWTHCWRFLAWLISAATQYSAHWTQTYYYSGFGNHKVVWHSSANDASFTTVTTGIETAPSTYPPRQPYSHV